VYLDDGVYLDDNVYLDDGAKSAMMYIVCAAALISRLCFLASSDGSSMTMLVLQTFLEDFGSLQHAKCHHIQQDDTHIITLNRISSLKHSINSTHYHTLAESAK